VAAESTEPLQASPVTTNVIAWLSNRGNVMAGKPTLLAGAGGRMGTSRAQYHLRTMGAFLDLHIMNKPEVCINAFAGYPVFDDSGMLVGEKEASIVADAAKAFGAFARATIAGRGE
jgi:chromate reductase, NAD(P)H dehydrogenase (quinone)